MGLGRDEINALLEKLRDRYMEYAAKYSPRFFDSLAFEERFSMAVRNRMDMEAFILAEITNFEQLKAKYEEKQNRGEISRKIDGMIEENLKAVRKYPEIALHPRTGVEFPHFLGAINALAENYLPALWLILTDTTLRTRLNMLEQELADFAVMRGNLPPKKGESLALLLARKETREVDAERARNAYMKECAFILHDIISLCSDILISRDPELELPLRFDKTYQSADRKKKLVASFNGHTGYGCALKVQEAAENIINDFRLKSFKRAG